MFNSNTSWFLEIPSSGGTITTQNVVYVAKNWNDSTWLRNRLDKPFLTIQAAINAAQGWNLSSLWDLIYIYPGVYTETVINNKDNTFMYFAQWAIITTWTSTTTLRITWSNVSIYWYVQIWWNSSQLYSISIENNTTIFNCEYLKQNVFSFPNDNFINVNSWCSCVFDVKEMYTYSQRWFNMQTNSYLRITLNYWEISRYLVEFVANWSCDIFFNKILYWRWIVYANPWTGNIYLEWWYVNWDLGWFNRWMVFCDWDHVISLKDTVTNKYSVRWNGSWTTVVKVLGNVQEKLDSTSINPITQQVWTIQVSADIPDL